VWDMGPLRKSDRENLKRLRSPSLVATRVLARKRRARVASKAKRRDSGDSGTSTRWKGEPGWALPRLVVSRETYERKVLSGAVKTAVQRTICECGTPVSVRAAF